MTRKRARNFPGSLYKDRNGFYIYEVCNNYQRKSLSTGVKNYDLAVKVARKIYPNMIAELKFPNPNIYLPLNILLKKFLKSDHNLANSTIEKYTHAVNQYIKNKRLPAHPTTRSIHARGINRIINWGDRQGLKTINKFPIVKDEPRARIASAAEILIIKKQFTGSLKDLCLFSLYTGARQIELLQPPESIKKDYIVVKTKSKQSIKYRSILLFGCAPYIYIGSRHKISRYWGTQRIKFPNPDLQFRDLRRTFAVNKLKEGYSVFEISRLMGHSSISMTEWYLSPFKVTDIKILPRSASIH